MLILWFLRRQMSDSHLKTREGLEVSAIGAAPIPLLRECLWAAGARLCAQHGQPSPFPGRRSGAESSSGPTNPRASALTSFLSTGYYGIFQCSALWYCHLLQDSFILEHCLESPMIAAVQRSLRKTNQRASPSATGSEMQLQERRL